MVPEDTLLFIAECSGSYPLSDFTSLVSVLDHCSKGLTWSELNVSKWLKLSSYLRLQYTGYTLK